VTDDVHLRALLPSGLVDLTGRAELLAEFDRWFGTLDSVCLIHTSSEAVGEQLLMSYRLELAKGDQRWVCTQTAVCQLKEHRVATLDLLCSGFQPL
jgi:hypothetical protein